MKNMIPEEAGSCQDTEEHSNHDQVYRRVVELINIANERYHRRMPIPTIQYDLKGTTAGQLVSWPGVKRHLRYTIRLNEKMLKHHLDTFLQEVIPHEVAHLVVDWVFKRKVKPHGVEWRDVMVQCFNIAPNRCHDLPVEVARRHKRNHPYQCHCQTHFFTERRHRLAVKGVRYLCRSCGEALVFQSESGVSATTSHSPRPM